MRRFLAILALGAALIGQVQGADCPLAGQAEGARETHHHHGGAPAPESEAPPAHDGCGAVMSCGVPGIAVPVAMGPCFRTLVAPDELQVAAAAQTPDLGFEPPPPRRRA